MTLVFAGEGVTAGALPAGAQPGARARTAAGARARSGAHVGSHGAGKLT